MIFKKEEGPKKEVEEEEFYINPNPQVPPLSEIKDKTKINLRYAVISPYAYIHIFWDSEINEIVYQVEEPILTTKDKKILALLEEGIKELINISFLAVEEKKEIIIYLEKNIRVLLSELNIRISKETYLKLMYYIYRNFVGLNEIEPLLQDYFIEDIECNGFKTPIYLIHRKYRNLKTNIIFESNDILANFVEKLAQKCGKYISYANPLLDGRLPDGSRVNATFTGDISSRGPTFTIRKFTKEPWTPSKLIQFGTASPEILAFLWLLIEYERNIMIIGGTGSGKTSFLNSIAFFIPPQARIVSIEDTRELSLMHENWLPSVSRAGIGLANILGKTYGEVSLFDLLKESFRQRPDYVIVGEVRGEEAFVLFQGMASGHPSFGTMHAENVETMIKRLETEPINLSPSLVEAMDVVCVMVNTKVKDKLVRRLTELVEITSVDKYSGKAVTNTPFKWDPATDSFFFKTDSKVFDKIIIHYGTSKEQIINEFKIRIKLLAEIYKNNIFEFKEFQKIINDYYKTPEKVLKQFGLIK